MSLLSKQAIKKLLENGRLVIDPLPTDDQFATDAVEIHLGEKLYVWEKRQAGATLTVALWSAIDPSHPHPFQYKQFAENQLKHVPLDPDGIITIRPHTFYLADLRERIKLPPDVAMHVQGKST